MAGTLTPTPYQTVLDDDGVAVSGAKVYTYEAGTTTNATTYTTSALSVANANPIVADSAGRYVAYLAAGANLRFIIKTSADVTIDDQDNILSVPGAAVNLDVEATVGEACTAGQVLYMSSAAEASPLTAGLWYLTDADAAPTSTTAQTIGVAVSAIAINTAGTVRLAGLVTTAGSVVVGTTYYVSATAGALTSSAPTLSRQVGVAMTTSSLLLAAGTRIVGSIPNPITQDLLFTDNTYDIGKSGATRPRDVFASRNAVVGGTLAVNSTAADAIDVAGGITAGSGNVQLVGTDGKLSGPLSSTIIDDLSAANLTSIPGGQITGAIAAVSGANLTTLNASNISSGTLANARLPGDVDLGGTLDVTGATTLDAAITVAKDTDIACYFGKGFISSTGTSMTADRAHFGHVDCENATDYALVQTAAGATTINSKNGQAVWFGVNAGAIGNWTSTGLRVGDATTATAKLDVNGSLSKTSGAFKIDHPLESMSDHHLIHSFVEAPMADLIYRSTVTLVDGTASIDLDEAAGMTSGTWVLLCRDEQCFTSNETGWFHVRGSVTGSTLTIDCEEATCTDTVSWMVVACRKDRHMYDTEWTDDDGYPIIEPLKVAPDPDPPL
jgi:hypothetical protein